MTSLADIIPNRAHGYAWAKDRFQNEDDFPAIRPSGAFVSTVLDLAKWEAALRTDQILSAATKAEMWKPVALNGGTTYPYGFGWELDDWPLGSTEFVKVPMIRHEGSMNGFRAGFVRFPTHDLTVIVLTNRSGTPVEGLAATIAVHYVPELRTPVTNSSDGR